MNWGGARAGAATGVTAPAGSCARRAVLLDGDELTVGAVDGRALGGFFSSTAARTAPTAAMPAAPSRAAENPSVRSARLPISSAPNAAATAVIAARPRAEPI